MNHKCKEAEGKEAYYDGGGQGNVTVESTNGRWCAGADDAGLIDINFCPYCGIRLSIDGSEIAKQKKCGLCGGPDGHAGVHA